MAFATCPKYKGTADEISDSQGKIFSCLDESMKKHLSTIVLCLLFFIGLSVLLYPAISDYWNSRTQSIAIVDYEASLSELAPEDYTAYFTAANQYNEALRKQLHPLISYDEIEGYDSLLNVGETGIMGYISIDKIHVELPIYHGTSPTVLNQAVGHLQGTSLPIGGESTHCVLSAHRGLPSARLFTDLDRLEEGDTFTLTVLNEVLTYAVEKIEIVKPEDVASLQIIEGEDHCTLVTCTPYGINTHRLLVHGTRIETIKAKPFIYITAAAYKIDPLIVTPVVAMPMLLVLLMVLMVKYRRKK